MNGRLIGAVYLLYFVAAIAGEIFAQQAGISMIGGTYADPAMMANKLLAHEQWFRAGFALTVLAQACYLALTALFYRLFKPVNPTLSLLAAFFSVVANAIQLVAIFLVLTPLVLLSGSSYLHALSQPQLQALAVSILNVAGQAGLVFLPLFGLFMVLIGYLIFRSTFLPRALGVFFALSGFGWLTYLLPALAHSLRLVVLALALSEGALMLWLLTRGVDENRWMEQSKRLRG